MKASFLLPYHAHLANKHDFVNSSTVRQVFSFMRQTEKQRSVLSKYGIC